MNKVEAPKPMEYMCDRKGKPRKNGTVRKSICPHQNRLCCIGGWGTEFQWSKQSAALCRAERPPRGTVSEGEVGSFPEIPKHPQEMGNLFFLFSLFRLFPAKTFQFSLVLNDFLFFARFKRIINSAAGGKRQQKWNSKRTNWSRCPSSRRITGWRITGYSGCQFPGLRSC